jgi:hypothetical protein
MLLKLRHMHHRVNLDMSKQFQLISHLTHLLDNFVRAIELVDELRIASRSQ